MNSTSTENVCRLCTNRGKDYHDIFTSDSSSISDKINNCLPIVIHPDDGLPSHICFSCLVALNTSDALRIRALEADQFLRKQVAAVVIKQEQDISDNEGEEKNSKSIFCRICEVDFDDSTTFHNHMESCHSTDFTCSLCQEDFKSSEALSQHKCASHSENCDNDEDVDNVEEQPDSPYSVISDTEEVFVDCGNIDKKPSICSVCEVTIPSEELVAVHEKFHAPRPTFCSQCYQTYPSPYDLFIHKQQYHKRFIDHAMKWFCEDCERFSANPRFLTTHAECKKTTFKCKHCDAQYTKHRELFLHQKKQHFEQTMNDPDVEKFQCRTCDKKFIDKADFRGHERIHRLRIERRYSCTKCGGTFLSRMRLKTHMDDVHVKRRDHKCDICKRAYTSRRNLMIHHKRHLKLTCRECGELFGSTKMLNKHLLALHNITALPVGNFACKECGRKFVKSRLLEDHMNCHSGNRPYVCEICNETFRTYAARWGHIQKHKNEKFVCEHCNGQFGSKNLLRRHMACHLSPENWRFACKICEQRFHRKSYLETHMKKHNDTRPFLCVICDSRYLTERLLKKHQRRHSQPLFKRIQSNASETA